MNSSYPPTLKADFMGAAPPMNPGGGLITNIEYFQQYRNDNISRMKVPSYEWGMMDIPYTPNTDFTASSKTQNKYLKLPQSLFSMIDVARQQEVDDFYIACQMHRDQYRDFSGSLHPLDFFKKADYMYQCPMDPTSKYAKYPEYYVKYKQPIVLPLTYERSSRSPSLPDRALTGVYNPSSDISYKR